MSIYAIISRLLDYPAEDLLEHLPEAHARLAGDATLAVRERDALRGVLDWMASRGTLALQADYVETFDTAPENALYLTHHTFGDSRERGPALVELGEHYKDVGLVVRDGELPDFLPLMLEYVALIDPHDPDAAQRFLDQARPIVSDLAARLEAQASPFAPLLRFVAGHGRRTRAAA
jgi:nitrate reductase delta subunit